MFLCVTDNTYINISEVFRTDPLRRITLSCINNVPPRIFRFLYFYFFIIYSISHLSIASYRDTINIKHKINNNNNNNCNPIYRKSGFEN